MVLSVQQPIVDEIPGVNTSQKLINAVHAASEEPFSNTISGVYYASSAIKQGGVTISSG